LVDPFETTGKNFHGSSCKSFGLLKKVSSLESQVSDLMAKIVHLEECDAFLIGIIESAYEQLQCKLLGAPKCLLLRLLISYILTSCSPSICLDPAAENHRVSEESQLLRGYLDTNTFWVDAHSRSTIVHL
jgi:hypothetical protein